METPVLATSPESFDMCPPNTVLIFLVIGAAWTMRTVNLTYAKESLKAFKRELRSK